MRKRSAVPSLPPPPVAKVRKVPVQKPGLSRQDYGTPCEFIHAVQDRFGPITRDLAASSANAKALKFYGIEDNSLLQPWAENDPTGLLWLNPPFANLREWAQKCAHEAPRRLGLIAMLTPASVGSNWFVEHLHRKAMVLALSPRITFEGESTPYVKDLQLSVFGYGMNGFDVWRWK